MNKFIAKHFQMFVFIVLGILFSLRVVIDPDLWWQMAVGKYIRETGIVPQADLFSFSAPNYPYVYHTWLADVFLYLAYSRWGLWGVSIFYALVFATGFWFMAKAIQQRQSDALNIKKRRFYNWSLLFFVPFVAWIVEARVQVFTFVGLTILYYLFRLKNNRKLWLVPVLFIFWANLHGGFILGLGFLFLLSVLRVTERKKDSLLLPPIFILSCFASLFNPYGHRAFEQSFLIGTNTFNMRYNLDWSPLFNTPFPSLFSTTLLVGGFIYVLFLLAILSGERVSRQDKLLLVLFFFLSLRTRKYTMALLVVLIPAVVAQLAYWRKKMGEPTLPMFLGAFAAAVALIGNAALVVWKIQRSIRSERFYARLPAPLFVYPYDAVGYMKKHGVPAGMLNDIDWGGYLIWNFPGKRFFIDGRMDNFYIARKPFTVDYWTMINLGTGWRELMDKYRIKAIFGPPNWPLVEFLSKNPDWKVLFVDDASVLLTYTANPNRRLRNFVGKSRQ